MKRFSFPLQKLLSLREFREKEAEIELGKAIGAREKIQLELDDVARKRVASAASRSGGVGVHELIAIEHYINRLDIRKEKLLQDLAAADLVVERARESYLAATRDRQVITKLREKKETAWRKEVLDAEADILDDMSNSREPGK